MRIWLKPRWTPVELREYYVVPADYVTSGELLAVEKEFAPLGSISTVDMFTFVLDYNLIGDEVLTRRISKPTARLQTKSLADAETNADADFGTRFVVGYGVLFIFFFVLTMSSSFMLRSVSREKENYTVEVLLVSLRPRELMLGKVLGLGTVALLQMGIWLGGSYLTLQRGDSLLKRMGLRSRARSRSRRGSCVGRPLLCVGLYSLRFDFWALSARWHPTHARQGSSRSSPCCR